MPVAISIKHWNRIRPAWGQALSLIGHNWVFVGSDEGGKTFALLRSFVASFQRAGVDPFTWFKDILSRIADPPISRLAEPLPHNWVPAQA